MTLALADVCDLDCVASWSPLVFDLPATERYARGGDAIVRRVLYSLALNGGLLELPGRTLEPADLSVLRSQWSALAEAEDFVQSVSFDLRLDAATSTLSVAAAEVLIDGRPYALEVATSGASAALSALGSTSG